jgi:hypothetical protein
VVTLRWASALERQIDTAFNSITPPDGPGGLGFVIVFGGGALTLLAMALAAAIVCLVTLAMVVGQTLVPPQEGPNSWGEPP